MTIAGRCLLAAALSTAFLAGAIPPSPIASALDASVGDGAVSVPEIYLPDRSAQHCVIRVDLDGADAASSEPKFLRFMDRSYSQTQGWRTQFIVAGVDYVEFRYFYVVSYDVCEKSRSIMNGISRFFAGCAVEGDSECVRIETKFVMEHDSRLVQGPAEHEAIPPVSLFERYRRPDDLQSCTIKIPARIPSKTADLQLLIHKLNLLRSKYRMSILDIHLSNSNFFVLLARQCVDIKLMHEKMLTLLAREDFRAGDYLGSPEFMPDISKYRLSETGSTAPSGRGEHSYVPERGFVPDAATAIQIAEAVLIPIYGEDSIARERPFVASLEGDVWRVRGSLALPPGTAVRGGVAEIEIAKQDGRIIRVTHGR
jgi:NTF2 fold immunity protein